MMDALRWAIFVASLFALFMWWRAGHKNRRFMISRWAVMLIPAVRIIFYIIRAFNVGTPATLNTISSWLILWTMIVLAIWGWMVADE